MGTMILSDGDSFDPKYRSTMKVRVDKNVFNYMLAANMGPLKAMGFLESLHAIGDGDDMYISGEDTPENNLVWSQFLALYRETEDDVTMETIRVPRELATSELPNELQGKFGCICPRTMPGSIEVVCPKHDLDRIRTHIEGAIQQLSVCTYDPEDTSPVFDAGVLDLDQQGESKPAKKSNNRIPAGYDVGGVYRVILHMANIVTLHVDAITNAANRHLGHGSGVSKAISDAAGPELVKECDERIREQKSISVSEVVRTEAGELPCRMVLHAVGPKWPLIMHTTANDKECLDNLEKTFYNVMLAAEEESAYILAIPPISSGAFRVPLEHVVESLTKALLDKASHMEGCNSSIQREIHIVDITASFLNQLSMRLDAICEHKHPPVKVTRLDPDDVLFAVNRCHVTGCDPEEITSQSSYSFEPVSI